MHITDGDASPAAVAFPPFVDEDGDRNENGNNNEDCARWNANENANEKEEGE